MSYPIYKINIPNENIVLHFCLEEEMKLQNSNDKCMNMYIYEDDTLIEVIISTFKVKLCCCTVSLVLGCL